MTGMRGPQPSAIWVDEIADWLDDMSVRWDEVEQVFRQTYVVPDWFGQLLPFWQGWVVAAVVMEQWEAEQRMRREVDLMLTEQLSKPPPIDPWPC